jgi:uncharacterized domain 1
MFDQLRKTIVDRDPFARYLGITIESIEEGYAKAVMPHKPELCNGLGNLHGGASFTLADMAFAGVAMSGNIVTVNCTSTICYTASGKEGPYTAIGRLVSESRRLCTIEVVVTDKNGTLIGMLTGTGYRKGVSYLDAPEPVKA